MSNQMWLHDVRITIDNNSEKAVFKNVMENREGFEMSFHIPFSDMPIPSEGNISIYNLSKNSINKIKKGAKVTVEAGYKGDVGVISSGTITSLLPTTLVGVDRLTTFTFLEGTDYSEKKEVEITFAKGSNALSIINRVASTAKIPISSISLKKNKIYGSGYTANGSAMDVLEEVVTACESSIYYKRGKLVIRDIKAAATDICNLSTDTGLINQPSRVENDDYKGWSIESLLQHRISTASKVKLTSKNVSGTFSVKNGEHSFSTGSMTTTCEVV